MATATARAVRSVACMCFRRMVSTKDNNTSSALYLYPHQIAEFTPILLCRDPRLAVLLNTIKEDLATLRVLDMFHTDVYTPLNEWISDVLVANRAWRDIVDDACSAVGALSIHTYQGMRLEV